MLFISLTYRVILLSLIPLVLALVLVIDRFMLGSYLANHIVIQSGFWGEWLNICLAPLIHDNFKILAINAVVFILGGSLILKRGLHDLVAVIAFSLGGSILCILMFSQYPTNGADGISFGILAFLLVIGFYEKNIFSILFAVVLVVFLWKFLLGVIPVAGGVNWPMNFGGAMGGLAAAGMSVGGRQFRRHFG